MQAAFFDLEVTAELDRQSTSRDPVPCPKCCHAYTERLCPDCGHMFTSH
jgi:hypothetical protein